MLEEEEVDLARVSCDEGGFALLVWAQKGACLVCCGVRSLNVGVSWAAGVCDTGARECVCEYVSVSFPVPLTLWKRHSNFVCV